MEAKCMDAKWSAILVLTMVLVAELHWSGHSPSLPSLVAHAYVMQMLAISRMDEQ